MILFSLRTPSAAQRLGFALLASLLLHVAVLWPLGRQTSPPSVPPPMPALEATLSAPALATQITEVKPATAEPSLAESVRPEPPPPAVLPAPTFTPKPPPARPLQGRALSSALAVLAKEDFYPRAAIERGIEGDVIVLLVLTPTGEVVSASVATGSGHGILDVAALAAVRRIHRLPTGQPQVLLPVQFRLD